MALPFVWVVLAITADKRYSDRSRPMKWLQIPFVGISFQPSTFAALVCFVFVALFIKTRETD
jgi:cell division protein FtsW